MRPWIAVALTLWPGCFVHAPCGECPPLQDLQEGTFIGVTEDGEALEVQIFVDEAHIEVTDERGQRWLVRYAIDG